MFISEKLNSCEQFGQGLRTHDFSEVQCKCTTIETIKQLGRLQALLLEILLIRVSENMYSYLLKPFN